MKTIGEILKNARVNKKYSLAHVEGLTKIKKDFIDAIERHKVGKIAAISNSFRIC